MFPDHVYQERTELLEKIATADTAFLEDNAAALMRITWELQASLALELQTVQRIRRIDVSKIAAVDDFAQAFSDYVDQGSYNLQRTSCGRIGDIYWHQIRALEDTPAGARGVAELDELLQRFTDADAQFTDEIEPFMSRARDVVLAIRDDAVAGRMEEARQRRDDFATEYRDELAKLRSAITDLNNVGRELLARL